MRFERNFSDGRSRSLGPTFFLPQVQQPSYSSDLLLQSIMADEHPFRMPFPSNKPAPISNVVDDGPPLMLLGGGEILSTCASSMTESEVSSQPTQFTECSSLWSHKYPVPREPPQVIKVAPRQPLVPTTLPYAQLCFDPENKTLVTLMEINLGGDGRRSKRLRILDSNEAPHLECQENPSWLMSSSSSTSTESTVSSTRSNVHAEETKEEAMFQDDVWFEETDLDLYLLHDFEADPWRADPRGGCTEALKKMLLASRSFLVFRHRHHHQDFAKESSFRINYEMLDNEMHSSLLDQ